MKRSITSEDGDGSSSHASASPRVPTSPASSAHGAIHVQDSPLDDCAPQPAMLQMCMSNFMSEFGCDQTCPEALLQANVFTLRDFAYGLDKTDLLRWPHSRLWMTLHDQACRVMDSAAIARGRLRFAQQASLPAVAASVQPHPVAHVRPEGRLREAATLEVATTSCPTSRVVPSETSRAHTLASNLVELLFSSRAGQMQECNQHMQSQARDLLRAKYATYSPDTLRNAVAAWRRWSAWCERQTPRLPPLPMQAVPAAMFLSSVQRGEGVKRRNAGGPGAVGTVLSGLKFLRDHLGLHMHLDDELVSAPADAEPPKPLKQAPPFTIRDLGCFERLTSSPSQIFRYLGSAAALLTYSGVRFKHAQRSSFVSELEGSLRLRCSRGKT